MTDVPIDGEVTTDEEFRASLGQLLLQAIGNGIDPAGSWVYRDGGSRPDWEVMFLELSTLDETE